METAFPTPAGIRRIIDGERQWKNKMAHQDPLAGPAIAAPSPYRPYPVVPWACLTYEQTIEKGLVEECLRHTSQLPDEKRVDYIKYLTRYCFFPRTLFNF